MIQPSIRLIVGLGNPGQDYAKTRHNAGAWFTEKLLETVPLSLKENQKFKGLYAIDRTHEKECHFLIPTTFMNNSGEAVLAISHFYKILPTEILIAHDELALPPGTVRLKQGGGHAGHNGLRDIITHLGDANFLRLRIGIGHPGNKDQVTDYVLSRPSVHDRSCIEASLEKALCIYPDVLTGKINQAMQQLHTETSEDEE
jgi:PTH1 family peptidyl-tRNA hydrolase